jgi:hypothetical protein
VRQDVASYQEGKKLTDGSEWDESMLLLIDFKLYPLVSDAAPVPASPLKLKEREHVCYVRKKGGEVTHHDDLHDEGT